MTSDDAALRVVHAVRSDSFAGVERYITAVATHLAAAGHEVSVVGGQPERVPAELGPAIPWTEAASSLEVAVGLLRQGRVDVVHAHMSAAEAAAVLTRPAHRGRVVSTRHFPDPRGRTVARRMLGRGVLRGVSTQIAISQFVADAIREPAVVVLNGVTPGPPAALEGRLALMLMRLEPEKRPLQGLRAWAASGLGSQGWRLAVAGSGRLEEACRNTAAELGIAGSVDFLGRVSDTDGLLSRASMFLAPAPAEPFGLAVVEAMARGVPVVASRGGAHAETLGEQSPLLVSGDFADVAPEVMRRLAENSNLRRALGAELRSRQQSMFSLDRHVERLVQVYRAVID